MAEAPKYEAYCVKCRKKVEMKEPQEVEIKGKGGSKRRAVQGTCPDCGTKVFKILGKA
jgi:DNA-directed RNA polymerase subunit RPC12/RpoP